MWHSSFERILGILCSVLDAYSAVLFLPDELDASPHKKDDISYHLAAVFSLGDKVDLASFIQPGKGVVGWILRYDQPLLVPNFDQRQNYLGYYRDNEEQRIKAFMGCPLPGGRGILCVDSKRQYSFSEKDQKLLQLFAQLLAELSTDVDHRHKHELTAHYYTSLKTIHTLRRAHSKWPVFLHSFLSLLAATLNYSYAVFCVGNPENGSYCVEGENIPLLNMKNKPVSFPLSSGLIGWVFRNEAPLFSGGPNGLPEASLFGKGVTTPHFQTVLALPLVFQRKIQGVLCLAHDAPTHVDDGIREFMELAAEYLALFLENLYVKCRLRDAYHDMAGHDGQKE